MTILVIGQSNYDINVDSEQPVIENQKYHFEKSFSCPGGPAFIAACLLGKWGEDVYLISRIGNDGYGQILRQEAEKCHVHLDYLIDDPNFGTPYSLVVNHQGNRTLFNFVQPFVPVAFQCDLKQVDAILTDGHEIEISLQLMQQYPLAKTVMDLGSYHKGRMKVAEKIDYLITSSQFAESYTGLSLNDSNYCAALSKVQNVNHKHSAVTLGERGCIYWQNNKACLIPPFQVDSVDSTGAGDIFHGAFTYFLNKGYSYEDCLVLASKAGSISVKTRGAYYSIPEKEQIEK